MKNDIPVPESLQRRPLAAACCHWQPVLAAERVDHLLALHPETDCGRVEAPDTTSAEILAKV